LHAYIRENLLNREEPAGRVEINAFQSNSAPSNDNGQVFVVIRVVHNATKKSILYSDSEAYVERLDHLRNGSLDNMSLLIVVSFTFDE